MHPKVAVQPKVAACRSPGAGRNPTVFYPYHPTGTVLTFCLFSFFFCLYSLEMSRGVAQPPSMVLAPYPPSRVIQPPSPVPAPYPPSRVIQPPSPVPTPYPASRWIQHSLAPAPCPASCGALFIPMITPSGYLGMSPIPGLQRGLRRTLPPKVAIAAWRSPGTGRSATTASGFYPYHPTGMVLTFCLFSFVLILLSSPQGIAGAPEARKAGDDGYDISVGPFFTGKVGQFLTGITRVNRLRR